MKNAQAFCLTRASRLYFRRFPRIGNLRVTRVRNITTRVKNTTIIHTFEQVMSQMDRSRATNFVLFTHAGHESVRHRLARRAGTRQQRFTHWRTLFILRGIDHVWRLIAEAKKRGVRSSPNKELKHWIRIYKVIQSWKDTLYNWNPQNLNSNTTNVKYIKKAVDHYINHLIKSLFPRLTLRRATARVKALIRRMKRLQNRKIDEIQFRGCYLGNYNYVLYEFRKFFQANSFHAPDTYSVFCSVRRPRIGQGRVNRLKRGHSNETLEYKLKSGRVAIRFVPNSSLRTTDPNERACRLAADSRKAINEWIQANIMKGARYRRRHRELPIHFLELNSKRVTKKTRLFPLQRQYKWHIQYNQK